MSDWTSDEISRLLNGIDEETEVKNFEETEVLDFSGDFPADHPMV